MILAKTLAGLTITSAVALIADVNDASTGVLAVIGVVGAIFTAVTAGYSAFRKARHDANVMDADLIQPKLTQALAEIKALRAERDGLKADLRRWEDRWESLYNARESGSGRGIPPIQTGPNP